MSKTILTLEQAAARINRSPDTLRYWRRVGEGPVSFRLGRRVVYDEGDLDAWIASQRAATSTPPAS